MAGSERNRRLLRMYGINEEQYEAILDFQGRVCGICGKPPKSIRLAVEHDHRTGLLRGLACSFCNRFVIGRGLDYPKLHEDAAFYLRVPPAQQVIPGATVPKEKK